MAKISANGRVVGTIEFLTSARRYMSNGYVLKNIGFGWKRACKLKPGLTPESAYAAAKERMARHMAENPETAAYVKLLHKMAGVGKRWKLHAAVSAMPDDPDGVWSEACDGYGDNVKASVDQVVKLCASYRLVKSQARAMESV